jgi:hypothetical protein
MQNLQKLIHTLNNQNEKLLILKKSVDKDVKTKKAKVLPLLFSLILN